MRGSSCASCGATVSVARLPSIFFALLDALVPLLTGLLALMLVGSFSSTWAFALTFVVGALIGVAPVLWAYVRFVPLVRRGA